MYARNVQQQLQRRYDHGPLGRGRLLSGAAGLEETVLNQDVAMDISDLVSAYGDHISEAVDQEAFYAVTTLTDEVIGVPSVVKTKTRGLLARKDYMTRVGYTESAEEAAASGGSLKLCKTIDDFNDMLVKMKAQIPECTTPLIGNSYDLEFTVLAGVCGTAGYQYKSVIYNDDGTVKEVVPGWLSEGYGKARLRLLMAEKRPWESDNRVDQRRSTYYQLFQRQKRRLLRRPQHHEPYKRRKAGKNRR